MNFKDSVDIDILSNILVVLTLLGTLNIRVSPEKRESFFYYNQVTEAIHREALTLLFILLASF